MSEKPQPLPPEKSVFTWKRVTLWLLPTYSILAMILFGFLFMYLTKGEKMVLIVSVSCVLQIALLSILSEIHGRQKAAIAKPGGRDPGAARRFHSRAYFVIQFIVGPPVALFLIWIFGFLISL